MIDPHAGPDQHSLEFDQKPSGNAPIETPYGPPSAGPLDDALNTLEALANKLIFQTRIR